MELWPGKQWVQIDLEQLAAIYAILVWHDWGPHHYYCVCRDVIVQVADDADFVKNVRTLFNNDHDNSSGLGIGKDKGYIETHEGKLIDAKGVKARFVRLYSNGNSRNEVNQSAEVAVYGSGTRLEPLREGPSWRKACR